MYNRYVKIRQKISLTYLPYWRVMADIVNYNIVSAILFAAINFVLKQIGYFLIRSAGRVAVTTGDPEFFYKTWQGPLLVIIAIVTLFLYVAFDLNAQIIYASKLLNNKPDLLQSIKEGLYSIPKFFTIDGLGIVLYIALIAPLLSFGLSISLTENFYIPNFIYSVIVDNTLYHILYYLFLLIFLILGVVNIFTIHGVLLSGLKSNKADDESRAIMRKNWKDFLKQNFLFVLASVLAQLGSVLFVGIIPGIFLIIFKDRLPRPGMIGIFLLLICVVIIAVLNLFNRTFYIIRMTQLYYRYRGEEKPLIRRRSKKAMVMTFIRVLLVVVMVGLVSFILDEHFDEILGKDVETKLVAHRAGGSEAPENTVKGIEKAIELGAYGAEIDIQRTKDGYYILNHDNNFARLCSSSAKPQDLTLEEVKQLTIKDPNFPDDPQEVATFEEILDACKGRIILFTELKGNTADEQMVDDAVRIIKEKGMEDEVVLISLKYNLIAYCEEKYPEMQTGYLTFASFGNTAELNCDFFGLEEEASTSTVIQSIHDADKQVMVWTVNNSSSQGHFIRSNADCIITDNVSQAIALTKELNERGRVEILMDLVLDILGVR